MLDRLGALFLGTALALQKHLTARAACGCFGALFPNRTFVMLEFLRRHHKTFWIVVTAIVIVSFAFFGAYTKTGNRAGVTSDDAAFTAYGREYSYAEFQRLGRLMPICYQLDLAVPLPTMMPFQMRGDGFAGFAEALAQFAPRFQVQGQDVPPDFVFNLIMLRHELEKYGIRASDGEVKNEFRQLPAFLVNGEFDRTRAEAFESNIGSYGLRVSDIYDLIRDWLGMQKLIQIVTGNVVASPGVVDHFYSATNQTVKASTIEFKLDDFKKAATVTDDEVKKYFEQKKDQFRHPEKRAVSYVFFEEPKDLDKATPDERRTKNNAFMAEVGKFSKSLEEKDATLEKVAAASKKELKKVPAFTREEAPEPIKTESAVLSEIFLGSDGKHDLREPAKATNGYYFYQVTAVEESKPQELKDAEPKIKETLIAQKAQEAITKAANDARKKLEESVKAGKKLEDAAKEAKLEVKALPEITIAEPPKDLPDARQIIGAIEITPAGSFASRPVNTLNGMLLVYVNAKELRKREDSANVKQSITRSLGQLAQRETFRAWFEKRRDEAKVVPHFRTREG